MVLVKILKLSLSLFFFKLGLNILFDLVLERKQGFPADKNEFKRKSKNWDFFKGGNPWFCSKF